MATTKSKKSADRRSLRFASIADALTEVDRLLAADRAGTLRRTGNWTLGQCFNHVASWINYGYEGYPFKTPWIIRLILRTRVGKYLRDGMPVGVRIPGPSQGTYATDDMNADQAAENLRSAFKRLEKGESAKFDSPAFGPMSHEDRVRLNLRHAELHLSFQHPQ